MARPPEVSLSITIGVLATVNNEKELLGFYDEAMKVNVPAQLIKDAGKTVVEAGTVVCMGIGSANKAQIDLITGGLKLIS